MPHAFLADLVTAVHLAIVVFMLALIIAVPIGGLLGWRWIRSMPLRLSHLTIMAYIVFNAARGKLCFLTHWEMDLRALAGQRFADDYSFIGRLLHDLLFVEVDQSLLHWIYGGVGLFVLAGIVLVPPRRRAQPPTNAA